MRIVLIILVVLVLGVVGGGLWLAANLNDLVRTGVETMGPEYTGTSVTLEDVNLSLMSGEGEIRGLEVGNPEGFEGGPAIRLGAVRVALDTSTLTEPVVVIREVIVDGAEVNVVMRSLRDSNLQQIMDNVQAAAGGSEAAPAAEEETAGPQVVVDLLRLTNTAASVTAGPVGPIRVSVPDIERTDIGREGGGADPAVVVRDLLTPVLGAVVRAASEGALMQGLQQRAGELRDQLEDRLGEQAGDVLEQAGGLLDGLGGRLRRGD